MPNAPRNSLRRFLQLVVALRRYLPEPLRMVLRPLLHRWWLSNSERAIHQALQELDSSQAPTAEPNPDHTYGRVSIIIANYESLDYLKLCLNSIRLYTTGMDYNVIVVDNGSGPEVRYYLTAEAASDARVKIILNDSNLGFARANNQGVAQAEGDYVILLNNDTVVTAGWLGSLLTHLKHDPHLGMISPVTNWASNEAKLAVDYSSMAGMQAFARRYTEAHTGHLEVVPMLAMFCVALRRSVYDQTGPLDESFGLGMFEDDDYALRLQQGDYQLAVAHDSFVHHWGWSSFGRMPQDAYNQLFRENQARFETKWGRSWRRPRLVIR